MTHNVCMRVCFTSHFLGATENLLISEDGKTSWSQYVPDDAWVLDDEHLWPARDIATVAKLAGVDLTFPDEPTSAAMRQVGAVNTPWCSIIPRWKLLNMLRHLTRDVMRVLNASDVGYYSNTYEPSRRLLSTLARCKIDLTRLRSHVGVDGNQDVLETFLPDSTGFAKPVTYDQFRTRTGRLVVASGPRILTLKRTHRDIMTSRWKGGKVVAFDYTSLEARIAAIEAGHDPDDDIYSDLSSRVLGGAPRSAAKLAVLATMFGAGGVMLDGNVEPGAESWMMAKIRDYFAVNEVTTRLTTELNEMGHIRNKYGRRVQTSHQDNIIYSSYVQSSGVDIALNGFVTMCEELRRQALLSVPVFVLHDAMFVDMHPDEFMYIDGMCDVGSRVRGYTQRFPLKAKAVTE